MGNNFTQTHVNAVDLEEWTELAVHRETSRVVIHSEGDHAEIQTILLKPHYQLDKEIQIYQYRKTQNCALVKCYGVKQSSTKMVSFCGQSHLLTVLTQRIPYRLSQFPSLSFPQLLYVLIESLRGYEKCFQKFGSFQVEEEMIGLNEKAEIKVWVNENFAQNHPKIQKPLLHTSGGQGMHFSGQEYNKEESEMVQNIVRMILRRCEKENFSIQLKKNLLRSSVRFGKSLIQIQEYAKRKGINVPQSLSSLFLGLQNTFLGQSFRSNRKQHQSNEAVLSCDSYQAKTGKKISQEIKEQAKLMPLQIYQHRLLESRKVRYPIRVIFEKPSQQVQLNPSATIRPQFNQRSHHMDYVQDHLSSPKELIKVPFFNSGINFTYQNNKNMSSL